MENKFTKGILERQEREYRHQQRVSKKQPALTQPDPKPEPAIEPEAVYQAPQVLEPKPPPETITVAPPVRKASATAEPEPLDVGFLDLSEILDPPAVRHAKNKTFYLDADVIAAIKRVASSRKTTESKLVNEILRKLLLTKR